MHDANEKERIEISHTIYGKRGPEPFQIGKKRWKKRNENIHLLETPCCSFSVYITELPPGNELLFLQVLIPHYRYKDPGYLR
jgi:hypothetical protein